MPKVTFIEFNGTPHTVDAEAGQSLMLAAVNNNVPGIDADCGGNCACATCHVYVEPAWQGKVGEQAAMEIDMLDFAAETKPNSRLACQIQVTDAHEGLTVRMPAGQH
jgi:ferredoxin, 2Fe-2S